MRLPAALFAFAFLSVVALADPPAGYYDPANGLTGPALKSALHDVTKAGHTPIPYDGLFGPLRVIWQDPANSSNILLFYSSVSVSRNASTWNREHLWPRSRGVSTDGGPDDSDLFHIVPCDADVNSARSNLYFDVSSSSEGLVNPADPEAPLCTRDANSWEPQPSQKGDVARALFYMATRYDGTEAGTTDIELVKPTPGASQMANLDTLLAWHAADPPDAAERTRNDLIFATYQHNRNPFIDHPEWVAAIWGNAGAGLTALAQSTDTTAIESPSSTGAFLVQLSGAAPTGGVTVAFSMSGTAVSADYALGGSGVSFNPATRSGTVAIPAGSSAASITLAPINDGALEGAETAQLTVVAGARYTAIGGAAPVVISDGPAAPPSGTIASWNFNAASFADPVTASTGAGSLRLDEWTGTISSFTGVTGQALSLVGTTGNNSWVDIELSTLGFAGLVVNFWTQGTSTGFNSGTWSWSVDGVTFEPVPGANTAIRTSPFVEMSVDLRAFPALDNQPSVTLRYTLAGASGTAGNNRLDDLAINAASLPRVSVAASDASAAERGADPAVFTFATDIAAPAGGLNIAFQLTGSATSGSDYTTSGAVTIPAGGTSAALAITPLADGSAIEFDETVIAQIIPGTAYAVGANASATATLHDDTPYAAAWVARFPGFAGTPNADSDGDGLKNFEECFYDTNPLAPNPTPLPILARENLPDPTDGNIVKPFATLTYTRRTDTPILDQTQATFDLAAWSANAVLVSAVPGTAPSTQIVKWRGPTPLGGAPQFLRVRLIAP